MPKFMFEYGPKKDQKPKIFDEMYIDPIGKVYLNQFYELGSDKKPIQNKIPKVDKHSDFFLYQQQVMRYGRTLRKYYSNVILPIPISGFFRRLAKPPCFIRIPEYKAKIEVPPEDLLFVNEICLRGKKKIVFEEQALPKKLAGRYQKNADILLNKNKNSWDSQMILPPPIPECFDCFEDFKNAYENWMKSVKQNQDLPIHPRDLETILQTQVINEKQLFNSFTKNNNKPELKSRIKRGKNRVKKRPLSEAFRKDAIPRLDLNADPQVKHVPRKRGENTLRRHYSSSFNHTLCFESYKLERNIGRLFRHQTLQRVKRRYTAKNSIIFEHLTQTPRTLIEEFQEYGCDEHIGFNFNIINETRQTEIPDNLNIKMNPNDKNFKKFLNDVFISKSPLLNYQCFRVIENLLKTNFDQFIKVMLSNLELFYQSTIVICEYSCTSTFVANYFNYSDNIKLMKKDHKKKLLDLQRVLYIYHYLKTIAKSFIMNSNITSKLAPVLTESRDELFKHLKKFQGNLAALFIESRSPYVTSSLLRLFMLSNCPYSKHILSNCGNTLFTYLNILSSELPRYFNALIYQISNSSSITSYFIESFIIFAKEPAIDNFNPQFIIFIKTLLTSYTNAIELSRYNWISPFFSYCLSKNIYLILPSIVEFTQKCQKEEVIDELYAMLEVVSNYLMSYIPNPYILSSFSLLLKSNLELKNIMDIKELFYVLLNYINSDNEKLVFEAWNDYKTLLVNYPSLFLDFLKYKRAKYMLSILLNSLTPFSSIEFFDLLNHIFELKMSSYVETKSRRNSLSSWGGIPLKILKKLFKIFKKSKYNIEQKLIWAYCLNTNDEQRAKEVVESLQFNISCFKDK